jgi:cytochrome c553
MPNPRPARRIVPWLALVLAAAPLQAQTPPSQLQACIACHGAHGRSSLPDVPHLAGQQRAYLASQLTAFRSGERKNPLMQAIAAQLSPDDIKALARYWSLLPAVTEVDASSTAGLPSEMQMPAGFPAGFIAYDREQDSASGVITVRYANALALSAARSGTALPSGAIVMSAQYVAALDRDGKPVKDAQGRGQPGELRGLAGMELRTGWGARVPALLRNGDWHYGLWSPTGESRLKAQHAQCMACHQPQAAQQHIFTWGALTKPASP